MHPDGNHTRCEVRESTYRWKKVAWGGQPSDSVCGFLLLSQAPGVLASLGSSLLLTSCHIHLKDCSRHDGMARSASLTLSQCEQGMEGALWSSLLSTAWLIPPVYARMFVCLWRPKESLGCHPQVCHPQVCHRPTVRLGLSLDLNSPIRLERLASEPQGVSCLSLPNAGITRVYHHIQH